eukprot:CAMPEP_0116968846 /NCGR_PEP_ID=MMETSP0467-20121206/51519_1 /TAXON_ID=283647 /ORGANISM="Mesodinium pulex, Strain SPMC105" /LENGTH=99 /DNA_ID=CAMNT_0004659283 /DNA_START=1398 /DNA_END=1696 /DNA_ORIENTATION=+
MLTKVFSGNQFNNNNNIIVNSIKPKSNIKIIEENDSEDEDFVFKFHNNSNNSVHSIHSLNSIQTQGNKDLNKDLNKDSTTKREPDYKYQTNTKDNKTLE